MKVSIIIPVYNNEKNIERCLNSIFSQKTNYSYEVIAVTDPCTDKTLEIIKKFELKFPNFRNYNVSWRSISLARNKGIQESNGEYIMFIDADDYYEANAIETMVSTIEKTKSDVVSSSFYYVRNKGIKKNFFAKNATYDRKEMLKALMLDSYLHAFMWNKIYRADLLKKCEPFEGNFLREDTLINFQVFLNSNKLTMIKEPLYYYDKTRDDATTKQDKTRAKWLVIVFATERYLIEKYYPQLLSTYIKLHNRRKIQLWADKLLTKKCFTKEERREYSKEYKNALKILKSKKPLPTKGMLWEDFFSKIEKKM